MASEESIGSLESEALKRKERLKQLKRKHDDGSKEETSFEEKLSPPTSLPKLVLKQVFHYPFMTWKNVALPFL